MAWAEEDPACPSSDEIQTAYHSNPIGHPEPYRLEALAAACQGDCIQASQSVLQYERWGGDSSAVQEIRTQCQGQLATVTLRLPKSSASVAQVRLQSPILLRKSQPEDTVILLEDLPPGTHVLQISLNTDQAQTHTIELTAGQELAIEVEPQALAQAEVAVPDFSSGLSLTATDSTSKSQSIQAGPVSLNTGLVDVNAVFEDQSIHYRALVQSSEPVMALPWAYSVVDQDGHPWLHGLQPPEQEDTAFDFTVSLPLADQPRVPITGEVSAQYGQVQQLDIDLGLHPAAISHRSHAGLLDRQQRARKLNRLSWLTFAALEGVALRQTFMAAAAAEEARSIEMGHTQEQFDKWVAASEDASFQAMVTGSAGLLTGVWATVQLRGPMRSRSSQIQSSWAEYEARLEQAVAIETLQPSATQEGSP